MVDVLPEDAPSPRLCHLIKWPDFDGYGFNLHAERSNPGQFIGKIDDDSPAQMAGLREGDRIVEVNGVNISNENHRQVVERIKADPQETKLLVVDPQTDLWYREQDIVVKSSQMNVIYKKTPVPRPATEATSSSTTTNNTDHINISTADESGNVNGAAPVSPTTTTSTSGINHGASSLDTSDFNDDSIEQDQQVTISKKQAASGQDKHYSVATPPPMSPDSGKGDEVAEQPQVVTVEAEINHQTAPAINIDQADAEAAELITSAISSSASKFNKVSKSPTSPMVASHEDIQPDSLTSNHQQQQQQQQQKRQSDQVSSESFSSRVSRVRFDYHRCCWNSIGLQMDSYFLITLVVMFV